MVRQLVGTVTQGMNLGGGAGFDKNEDGRGACVSKRRHPVR